MKEIVQVNPDFVFCSTFSEPVIIELSEKVVDTSLQAARDNVTDEQCGKYRECFTRPSGVPGCGIRIQTDGHVISAECPAGTVEPYRNCASRVLRAIVEK